MKMHSNWRGFIYVYNKYAAVKYCVLYATLYIQERDLMLISNFEIGANVNPRK